MTKKILLFILAFGIIFTPTIFVLASPIVPDCGKVVGDTIENPCDFNYLIKLINNIITFLLIDLATPLFALIIIYTGWLYLSAGENSGNITKAKSIFKNAIIGYVVALASWLIVKTILTSLGFQPGGIATFFDYLK